MSCGIMEQHAGSSCVGTGTGFEIGECLWIPCSTEVWQAGVITGIEKRGDLDYLVVDVQQASGRHGESVAIPLGSQRAGSAARFYRRNQELLVADGAQAARDLSKLALLHEPAVLQALQLRFAEGIVYTSSGPVLLAVNPFRQIPHLYENAMLRSFIELQPGEIPIPHVYGTANDAYSAVARTGKSQTVLVSGESGSGKTETTKFVMRFIAFSSAGGEGDVMSTMENQVLQSIPLLEALGNAKTLRNDNSSRFGKYIEMQLRVNRVGEEAQLVGARTHTYLLEKVRVMGAREGERSFHIFYQVLAAASVATPSAPLAQTQGELCALQPLSFRGINIYGLANTERVGTEFHPSDFAYLSRSARATDIDEVKEFDRTLAAMREFNMTNTDISNVFSTLVAVLLLGNVKFRAPAGNSEGSEIDDSSAAGAFSSVSILLGTSAEDLQGALCRRSMKMPMQKSPRGEQQHPSRIAPHRTCDQATDNRDALARHLYGAIFEFVVKQVNKVLSVSSSAGVKGASSDYDLPFVGVLDIFGFEKFETNSFEQLCINFTNELLQQYFNEVIFKHEAALYMREQVRWNPQDFPDNGAIVELLSGVPNDPLAGVFPMLDEECNIIGGTPKAWRNKLDSRYKSSNLFELVRTREKNFAILHFAGPVEYNSQWFLDKNRDTLSEEVLECMRQSSNSFIRERFLGHGRLFGAQREETTTGRVTRAQKYSVSNEFRQQLKALMKNIRETNPHFVRCIKPNPSNQPCVFDRPSVAEQLRYQGVLEAIRVSRAGYSLRLRHREAVLKYRPLLPRAQCQRVDDEVVIQRCDAAARRLFELVLQIVPGMQSSFVQVGLTLVFFKNDAVKLLDAWLHKARSKAAIRMQARWRRAVAHYQYTVARNAAIRLQAIFRESRVRRVRAAIVLQRVLRGRSGRRIFYQRLGAIAVIQRFAMALNARAHFLKVVRATARLQRWHRSTIQWVRYRKSVRAATNMQRHWRGMFARMRASRLRRHEHRAASKIAHRWRYWVLCRVRLRVASLGVQLDGATDAADEGGCCERWSRNCSLGLAGELLAAKECVQRFSSAAAYEISILKRLHVELKRDLKSLNAREQAALCIQCHWRKTINVRRYAALRHAVVGLQSYARGWAARDRTRALRECIRIRDGESSHFARNVSARCRTIEEGHCIQTPPRCVLTDESSCSTEPKCDRKEQQHKQIQHWERQLGVTLSGIPTKSEIGAGSSMPLSAQVLENHSVGNVETSSVQHKLTDSAEVKRNPQMAPDDTSVSSQDLQSSEDACLHAQAESSSNSFETSSHSELSEQRLPSPMPEGLPLRAGTSLSDPDVVSNLIPSSSRNVELKDDSHVVSGFPLPTQNMHPSEDERGSSNKQAHHTSAPLIPKLRLSDIQQGEADELPVAADPEVSICLTPADGHTATAVAQGATTEKPSDSDADCVSVGVQEELDTPEAGCAAQVSFAANPGLIIGAASVDAQEQQRRERLDSSLSSRNRTGSSMSESETLWSNRSWSFQPPPRVMCGDRPDNSQRGFRRFWQCIGVRRDSDAALHSHRQADRLAAQARRRASRGPTYQALLTQAKSACGQDFVDYLSGIAFHAMQEVPQSCGSWGWTLQITAQECAQKLIHIMLAYNAIAASSAAGASATDQTGRAMCNQEDLSRLAAMCLGFLAGREEESFWLLHYIAEDVLGVRQSSTDPDAALVTALLSQEAPQLASRLGSDASAEVASILVKQCWARAFVGFLPDELLIALWEDLLKRKSSVYPRFPLLKWLLSLLRFTEHMAVRMLPTYPADEVVPHLCRDIQQAARVLSDRWRPDLSVSDRRALRLVEQHLPARSVSTSSWRV